MLEHESEIITLVSALVGFITMAVALKALTWVSEYFVDQSNVKTSATKLRDYVAIAKAYRLPDQKYTDLIRMKGSAEIFYAQTIEWITMIETNGMLFSKTWMGSPVSVLKTGKLVDDEMITPYLYPWLENYLDMEGKLNGINDLHLNPLDMAEIDGGGVFFSVFPSSFPGYVQYRSRQTIPRRTVELDGSRKLFLATRREAIDLLDQLGKSIARNSFNSPNKNKKFVVKRRGVREVPTPELIMEVISMDAPSPTLSNGTKLEMGINIETVHAQITQKLDEQLGEDWPSVFTVGHFILSQTPNFKYAIRAFSQWSRTSYNVHKYWVSDVDPFLMTVQELKSVARDTQEMKNKNKAM